LAPTIFVVGDLIPAALSAPVLLSFFLEVFRFSDLLVLDLATAGKLAPRGMKASFTDAFRTHGKTRQQLFDILAPTRGTLRNRRRFEHEQLEFVGAPAAAVFVNRHVCPVS
jgi:hypothetical protein